MALKRVALELGMGTDIRGSDYTKAAKRALHNALRQNSLSMADAFDLPKDAMHVKILIGVQKPDEVDKQEVANLLPYGTPTVETTLGGMDTIKDENNMTIMANCAVIVYLDLDETKQYGVPA